MISRAHTHLTYTSVFLSSGVPPVSADPSLTIWYDAVNSTYNPTNPTNDTYITSWADKSALAHDANTTGNDSKKPRYRTNIQNGKPSLFFDGVDDTFTINPFTSLQSLSGYTAFFVTKTNVIGSKQVISVMNTNSAEVKEVYLEIGSTGVVTIGGAAATATSSTIGTNFHIHTIIFDGSQTGNSNRLKHNLDGVNQTLTFTGTVGTTSNANTTWIYFGTDSSIANDLNGYISEVIVYTKTLPSGDITNTESYLKNKWAI